MIMQNGLAGNIFGGADVPGFIGVPSEEIWVRFYQLGMYYPFFRAHCSIDNVDREPWAQSERVQTIIRDSINKRYDMIHYLYTTFQHATMTG
jgi:alpha 1,3-glucosidase